MSQNACSGINLSGRGAPAAPVRGKRDRPVKRALDPILAGTALVAVAPLCLLIAILVKLDSKGPVFVTQPHFGRNGRRFQLPKLRTMHAGGGRHLVALPAHETAETGMPSDPRLTRVGRLLRRFSLDELPKLWSVLLGDMSLCGPGPRIADENEGACRLPRVGPGVTSPWQNGRTAPPAYLGRVWQQTRRQE